MDRDREKLIAGAVDGFGRVVRHTLALLDAGDPVSLARDVVLIGIRQADCGGLSVAAATACALAIFQQRHIEPADASEMLNAALKGGAK